MTKKEIVRNLALKVSAEIDDRDLEDGVTVLRKDWETVLSIADEHHAPATWDDDEWAIVDGIYVDYDSYEDWDAEEL